ncbi:MULTISPECIES: phage tail protein [unclassified Pseudomonas]|uniref:phage tail protein n=1 Tax=unclassified Pseudomonas TaxID=196821 RepID=UPI001A9EEB57|nr:MULTISPECIES: phage tail protein [unclassified Pseudomonas]
MPWYKTGTVSVVQNSNAVIGAGTAFIANSRVGDGFRGPDGRWYEVTNIASNTALSISPNYEGQTVAGGFYSIMPVQGYQKDLSDQVRAILNDYGEKLAALGTTGNYDILPASKGGTGIDNLSIFIEGLLGAADAGAARSTLGSAKSGANSDITSLSNLTTALSLAQGGTGGKNAADARTGLGLGSAAIAAILGTVSQSGGVPTGAIFEFGSSAAGSWVKFASGLMITVQSLNLTLSWSAVAANRYAGRVVGNTPAAFAAAPLLFVQVRDPSVAGRAAWCPGADATNGNTFSVFLASPAASTVTSSIIFNIFAIGRWF